MGYSTGERLFSLATPLGEDVLLVSRFEGTEHLSQLFHFTLTLSSEREDIAPADLIGQRVILRIVTQGGERHWSGFVSSFSRISDSSEESGSDEQITLYRCEVVPWLWFMTQHEDSRIFQNQTIPEIVESLFQEFKYSDYELHLSGKYAPLVYCTQYRETTFNFISRLLERAGIYYFFRHDDELETLVLTDNRDHNPALEESYIRFHRAGITEDTDSVSSLSRRLALRTGRIAMSDYNFERPASDLNVAIDSLVHVGDNADFERYLHPGNYGEREDGEALARVVMESEEAAHETLDGASNVRLFTAGHVFELEDHPDDALNEEYLIVGVTHKGENNLGRAGDDGGGSYQNQIAIMPHRVQYRAPLTTPRARIHGPQPAVVTGPPGEEIYTDKYGRIKVHFFWDRRSKRNDKSSCWIRVAQVWAGRQWGAVFIPRIGHEVLVDFVEGNPDAPIVVGSVYNGDNMPPYTLPAMSTISTLKTNSSKNAHGFNELRFEDKKGAEQVAIRAQNRQDICVNGVFCETNGADRNLKVGSGQGGGNWNMYVNGDDNEWTIGGHFWEIDKDFVQLVKGEVLESFELDASIMVGQKLQVTADTIVEVAKTSIDMLAPKITIEAPTSLVGRGGEIIFEGSDGGVTLRCGPNYIELTPDGINISGVTLKMAGKAGVDIDGALVKINCGGVVPDAPAGHNAKDATPEDGNLPLEPDPCQCSANPGGGGGGGGGGPPAKKGRRSLHVDPPQPPHWVPPRPPNTPPVPPPKPDDPKKDCSIKDLKVYCGHPSGGAQRRDDPATHLLQVVPNTNQTTTSFNAASKVQKLGVTGSKTSGGKDTITLEGVAKDGGTASIKTAVKRTPTPPSEGEYKAGGSQTFEVLAPANTDIWPWPATPDTYYCYGKGCDDAVLSCTVEAYPSQTYSGKLDVTRFDDLINKIFKTKIEWASKRWYGMNVSADVKGPTGSFELKWGWAENSDWRSYFGVSGTGTITFATGTLKGTANLRDMGIILGLSALDIPKEITEPLLEALDKLKIDDNKVLDILSVITLEIGMDLNVGLAGSLGWKRFPSGASEGSRSLPLTSTGRAFCEFKMRQGNVYIASMSIVGKGEAPLTFTGDLSIEDDGIYMTPSLDFKGLTIKMSVEFKAGFSIVSLKREASFQVFPPQRLWPAADDPTPPKWKLIPP